MSSPPPVIYVAGSGRSGSTLLERTLGEPAGFVNVGELIDLFRRVAPNGERCGCGLPFAACEFWARVGQQALSGWAPAEVDAVRHLQGRVGRQRHLPRLLAPGLGGAEFRADVQAYGEFYRGLYAAIAQAAGAGYIVDASKWPSQALALHRAGLDVRVIHLVRDIRGVAYSLGKAQVARPHAVAGADVMWHVGPASASARWLACQSETDLLRRCGMRVTRMRYEDFVREPRACVATALTRLGVPAADQRLDHIQGQRVILGPSHGLSGNPSRFQAGDVVLSPDEAWRAQMSRRDRALVTAIALPQLLRHGRAAGRTAAPAGTR
jgi:Sulfotransferase family